MSGTAQRVDWRALWRTGDLARFCFVSLGILLHATNETMIATIMPAMVGELSGVELVGWSLAIYELGSIVAGAAAGRLITYVPLRTNMMVAALLYSVGAAVCAMAPSMAWFLVGRLIEGFGGGALVALAFVSVERLFPRAIWPQLFAIMSAIWGVAAFTGPVLGALASELLSWRWAFGLFAFAGIAMATATYLVLKGPAATQASGNSREAPPFPYPALAVLAIGVILIASAGVEIQVVRSSLVLLLGLGGLALFFWVDGLRPRSRLFPSRLFDWRTPLGAGMTMIAVFSVATISFSIYGPLILTSLHGIPVLTTGYVIAAESIAWSVLSILVAGARPGLEKPIIVGGASMIALGIAGFAWAVPAGNIPAIVFCAVLQGGGFGIAWPFVTRVIVTSAGSDERTVASSAVPTMQRIGYAVGAATTGIIANASGFSHGLNPETARGVASWLFLAFIPLGLVGVAAAIRIARHAGTDLMPEGRLVEEPVKGS
ncbi:MFS transporter [Parvibaculum sp.]|uniref:MFS transporter n=1 Tax=Parvibaculum sp. TaxID=2024848 RepID=UPI003BAAA55B